MGADTLTHKRCPRCEQHKPVTEYSKRTNMGGSPQSYCKPCSIERMRQHRGANPQRSVFNNKKAGAKKTGVKFALVYENVVWNTICPVLGIELNYTRNSGLGRHPHPNSPSFDRIDPKKGYTPDNVIIVSHLANTIKSNATVDQLERVASFYRQFIPHIGASHV